MVTNLVFYSFLMYLFAIAKCEKESVCPPLFSHVHVETLIGHKVSNGCYYFGYWNSYQDAKQFCMDEGARLAEFDDEEDYSIIRKYLEEYYQGNRYWIGGRDDIEGVEGFVWPTSHSPITDDKWVPQEPSGTWQGMPEHCLSFDGRGRDDEKGRFVGFGLNDEFCEGQSFGFICQKVAEQ